MATKPKKPKLPKKPSSKASSEVMANWVKKAEDKQKEYNAKMKAYNDEMAKKKKLKTKIDSIKGIK